MQRYSAKKRTKTMTTQEQQVQSVTEASNGDDAAAIVLSGSSDAVTAKKRKKRKGAADAAVQIDPVPADDTAALAQQDDVGNAIDLATAQFSLTEEEKLEIVALLRRRKGDRLTEISDFAAQISAILDRQISEALAEQAEIKRRQREAAQAYTPPVDTDYLVELIKGIADRGRVLPGDYQEEDQED
jgi:hypothetical protein